jgi:hypothetical protein
MSVSLLIHDPVLREAIGSVSSSRWGPSSSFMDWAVFLRVSGEPDGVRRATPRTLSSAAAPARAG